MQAKLLILLFLFGFQNLYSQTNEAIEFLKLRVVEAKTDEQKIKALGELADYYYGFKLEKLADSIQQQQLLIAQISVKKELVLKALFENSITSIGNWSNKETFDRALNFIDKGLAYAKDQKLYDYEALAYIRKANILRKRGQYDAAIEEATHAFSTLDNTSNDSLRSILYLELGDILLAKDEAVTAYKNYNTAYDIAYEIGNKSLQSSALHRFAALYNKLNNKILAENYLLKSVEINKSTDNKQGLLMDFIDLSRVTDKKEYIEHVLKLSAELKSFRQFLYGKQLMLAYYMVVEKNSTAALNYLKSNEDLSQSFLNRGFYNYQVTLANCYRYGNRPDSAINYYLKAQSEILRTFEPVMKVSVLMDIAHCYKMMNQKNDAIAYYEKAYLINREINSLVMDSSLTNNLSALYRETGDYKKAYEYQLLYQDSKEQLQNQADDRQVVLLEMERENKQHEKDRQDLLAKKLRTKNLQYMGISIAIAVFFTLMLLVGMFPVSKFTIRMLGFFGFIFLFEFFIVMIDSWLHEITYGEPLKIWLCKIAIIAMMVPFHHYLEHALVKFLQSQKLQKLRAQISFKRIWENIKHPPLVQKDEVEEEVEENTAIL